MIARLRQSLAQLSDLKAGVLIVILHVVGVIGYLIPALNSYFLLLTPFNLLIVGLILSYFYRIHVSPSLIVLLLVFAIGLTAEIIGVQYGFLFGDYSYGSTLGLKILEVPFIIGVNWLVLTLSFGAVVKGYLKLPGLLSILLAAVLMVLLDILIEPVAIQYDYWSWVGGSVPLRNYIGWFIIAVIVQILIQNKRLHHLKRLGLLVVLSQLLFFIMLNIF